MHSIPILPYCGLTLVLSYPSRFDKKHLLTGFAGDFMGKELPLLSCDIRDLKEDIPFLPNTKVVLLLGELALERYNTYDLSLKLNQLRGNPWEHNDIIFIASYFPQDAMDAKAQYEQDYNPNFTDSKSDYDKGDEKSTKGQTARSNYRFWISQDCKKCKTLLQTLKTNTLSSLRPAKPIYRIFEEIKTVLNIMYRKSNSICDIDIETDYHNMMTVMSMSFNNEQEVWTVPLVRYHGGYAYNEVEIAWFLRALAYVFLHCTIVTHNGSSFDLPFLALNYKIAPPRNNYDTMLVHARLFPGIEKSLGHCGSLYTWEDYHKNQAIFNPHNTDQEHQLWTYNANDVWLMKLIRIAQQDEIAKKKAQSSIEQINSSIYPYIIMSLTGIRYNKVLVEERIAHNQHRLDQLLRILKILVGHDLLPTSPKSCVRYFHEELDLKVVKRTESGNPSLDEKSLYKLYVSNSCPTIPVALEYRRLAKENGMLKFTPYKI